MAYFDRATHRRGGNTGSGAAGSIQSCGSSAGWVDNGLRGRHQVGFLLLQQTELELHAPRAPLYPPPASLSLGTSVSREAFAPSRRCLLSNKTCLLSQQGEMQYFPFLRHFCCQGVQSPHRLLLLHPRIQPRDQVRRSPANLSKGFN